mmetsp:Transcript_150149/g.262314  ORF Transcript_150149/g.262314 Transcript_150149/m.262314 type:complete len:91 (+) Transcript_150149:45-317(+)
MGVQPCDLGLKSGVHDLRSDIHWVAEQKQIHGCVSVHFHWKREAFACRATWSQSASGMPPRNTTSSKMLIGFSAPVCQGTLLSRSIGSIM